MKPRFWNERRGRAWLRGLLLLACGCHSAPAEAPASNSTASSDSAPASATGSRDAVASPSQSDGPPPSSSTPELAVAPVAVEHLLETSVSSIAMGKAPKMAAYGGTAHLFDGKRWVERPIPEDFGHAPPADSSAPLATIFFGRDNQPRLMGQRADAKGPLYLRHKPKGWTLEPSELGGLASATTPLYGILGYDDPEIVCAVGSFCLVKSLRGWKRMPGADREEQFFLTPEGVYLERDGQLHRLEEVTWKPLMKAAPGVRGVCQRAPKRLWFITKEQLFSADVERGDAVESARVPVGEATALLCESDGSVWVVGTLGAALFDGQRWLRVDGIEGSLRAIVRGHGDVLMGGDRGLFRVRRATP